MSFHVGQKVVGVNSPKLAKANVVGMHDIAGKVFTVREIAPEYLPAHGMVGIRVEEIRGDLVRFKGALFEPAFLAHSFRPLQERSTETGMAILRKVADDASKKRNLVTTR